ncbi:ATP-binding protein [Bifidobacterium leontopitheci]|uniref:ATP-dependent DNA helicase RecG n=1 Tax=Bifidobacterium leontopitheci TaxID=2650774 RepID=A0A6I1GBL0_9BIFI|nr:ATP-binding protein [Bifidobacterium leontopitheci]KAB7789034.1 ATP-dependent DNA helicase RecG [Bifidobacterium leontopitheci]
MLQIPVTSNDVNVLAHAPESQYFDRKSAKIKPNDLARTIVAFANSAGGKIAVGIEDGGRISGFGYDGAQPVEAFEQCALVHCDPVPMVTPLRVPVVNDRGKEDLILILNIAASQNHVIKRKNDAKVFLRSGDKSVQLEYSQILALEYDKRQIVFEDEPVRGTSIEDVDSGVLDRYKRALGTIVSDEKALYSGQFLTDDGELTHAGVLLFAAHPARFMPQARVRVLRFEGKRLETGSQLNIIKDRTFEGPIPKTVEDASLFISGMLREYQYMDKNAKFQIIPEYPEFAWFEGLVNAVVHRDYANAGEHIRISMYDDRLEILSPGKLPNTVTLENMRTTRYARNPRIAKTLVAFGWVREMNEGVQRIYSEMQKAFLHDPVYSEPNGQYVKLTLENSSTSRVLRTQDTLENRIGKDTLDSLSEYEIEAVRLAYSEKRVTRKGLSIQLGRSLKLASNVLHSLVDKDILQRHGSSPRDPHQYYSLKQDNER